MSTSTDGTPTDGTPADAASTGSADGSADDGWSPSPLQRQRDAYRRNRARRSTAIAAVSTVLVVGVLALLVVNSSGWDRFRETFFDVRYLFERQRDGTVIALEVLKGLWLNVRIAVVAEIAILVVALAAALARSLRGPVWFPLRALAIGYTDLFRGLPQILVLLMFGFGMPALQISWLPNSALFWGAVGLVLSYGAYVSEVLRAGIESIHPSQRAASRSLGLTHGQTMRYVVVPQGVRRVLPALLNDFVSLLKDTGLISVLGVVYDAVLNAQIATSQSYNYTPYVYAGLLFVILTIPLTRVTDWVARRQGFHGVGGTV